MGRQASPSPRRRSRSRRVQASPRRAGRPDAVDQWKVFLRNHAPDISAMDFFTIPTVTFQTLYGFFVTDHGTRRIRHANVTVHPSSEWVVQQLREAFPYDEAPRFLIHDRDAKFGERVAHALASMGVEGVSTAHRSPWQNGVAERWIGSCRRELLDHVMPFRSLTQSTSMSSFACGKSGERPGPAPRARPSPRLAAKRNQTDRSRPAA